MKIFLIAIYTFNAILLFVLLYKKYINKMKELDDYEKNEKIYSDSDSVDYSNYNE